MNRHRQPTPAYFQYKTSTPKEIRTSKMPASVQMKDHLLNCLVTANRCRHIFSIRQVLQKKSDPPIWGWQDNININNNNNAVVKKFFVRDLAYKLAHVLHTLVRGLPYVSENAFLLCCPNHPLRMADCRRNSRNLVPLFSSIAVLTKPQVPSWS